MIKNEPTHVFPKTFFDFFGSSDLSDKVMVEFGSGIQSTIYFAEKFKNVFSFEDDVEWIDKVNDGLTNSGLTNVNLSPFYHTTFLNRQFVDLIETADYFLIDNCPNFLSREFLSMFIGEKCKNDAFIILDDSNIHTFAYDYLKSQFYSLDFIEFSECQNTEDKVTSVFYYRRFSKDI